MISESKNEAGQVRDWRRRAVGSVIAAVAGLSLSCTQSPATPSGSVTVATPAILAPANGSQIANLKQPVTLTVNNAFVADGQSASLYEFEVASDPGFASKTQSPTAPPGGNGQTSVVLATLPAGQTYYWHVRATVGGTAGPYSTTSTFAIGPALGLGAPTAVSPLSGSTPSGWPTFTVTNAPRTGSLAQVSYRFDVSALSTFSPIILTSTVAETGGQTSFTPSLATPVPVGTPLFWRATAIDAPDGLSGSPSATLSFTPQALTPQAILAAQLGQPLWPGAQPSGANGHAVLGDSCDGSPGWSIATCVSPISQGVFQTPTIEALRYFDLFDRGYDPPSAISWMISNGYPTAAQWYPPPDKAVLGLGLFYLAARDKFLGPGAIWDIVIGLG